MANQAIALQARAPQTDIMGRAIQQNAQMMNMMSQRRASARQAAAQQQEMQIAQAKEARDVSAAEIDMAGKKIDFYTKRAGQTMNAAGYQLLLRDMDRDAPEIAAAFRANLPPEQFDRNMLLRMVASVSDNFRATYGPLETEVVQLKNGKYAVARTGGFGGPGAEPGVFELEAFELNPDRGAAPPAPGAAPPSSAFPTTATPATDAQIDEAAQKIIRGAGVGELGISAEDFDRASARANQLSADGGARMQPVSMMTGPQMAGEQPDFATVVQDMMSSGQVSESNLQLMRAEAAKKVGPQADAQLAQLLKANNIQIVPDAQPGMRSAVFRPGEDAAPQMQQVQDMRNYRATGRAAEGKDPMQSPSQAPAAAGAVAEAQREPIPQAGARAEAQREPIPQAGARAGETERASKQAQMDVEFLEKYQSDKRTAQEALMLINRMIGDTNLTDGRLIYKKGGKGPHAGFEDVVGATWRPGFRLIEGTEAFDFDRMLKQLEGSAFLTAYERLKGGGPIASVEGEKGTTAVTRLARGLTEKEFVVAARELEASIRDAIRRADERYARIKGQKPAARGGTVDELVKRYGG